MVAFGTRLCPPRSLPYTITRPVVVYSDACGAGRIAAIAWVDGVKFVARTHLPAWIIRDGAGIFEFELAAVLLGVCPAICFAPGRSCMICCDNIG